MAKPAPMSNRIDYSVLAQPKVKSSSKGRKKRHERAVVQSVRPEVVARDGYCRLQWHDNETRLMLQRMFGTCQGPSEWSHYNETHRRSKTMGQAPEQRHTTAHSLMLCKYHANEYDQNRMRILERTERGCNGPLRFSRNGNVWQESE
jgi:hypothetical protein